MIDPRKMLLLIAAAVLAAFLYRPVHAATNGSAAPEALTGVQLFSIITEPRAAAYIVGLYEGGLGLNHCPDEALSAKKIFIRAYSIYNGSVPDHLLITQEARQIILDRFAGLWPCQGI